MNIIVAAAYILRLCCFIDQRVMELELTIVQPRLGRSFLSLPCEVSCNPDVGIAELTRGELLLELFVRTSLPWNKKQPPGYSRRLLKTSDSHSSSRAPMSLRGNFIKRATRAIFYQVK
jgi:hypothetical protein